MPYVAFSTSLELDCSLKDRVKEIIGELIALIPGKTVEVTMFNINGGAYLKKGTGDAPCAFVDVRLRGAADFAAKDAFVAGMCKSLKEEFGIDPAYVYINFIEFETWGSNGGLH